MKKGKGLLTLALGTVMAFSVAGVTAFAEQTDGAQDSALAMNTVLSTVEGYSSNGASQVRTTEELTGEYSVVYSVNGATPGNGWIAQQYLGLGEDGTYLQINLFVDSNITVQKMPGGESLPILDATTNEPMGDTRTVRGSPAPTNISSSMK